MINTNEVQVTTMYGFSLDKTGATDTAAAFQNMIDTVAAFPYGSTIKLPGGTYKLTSKVTLKDGIKLTAASDVIIIGTGSNTLFSSGDENSFEGIEFQNCATVVSVFQKSGFKIDNCRFTNNIGYAAINFYGASDCSVKNSYFYDIHKHGILIDNDSADITIDNNSFDNELLYGGYDKEQISGHVYCLNGTRITVTNNTAKNNGGQGIIFAYNSTTGKGTTDSVAINNQCIGNGQEGVTTYGGDTKLTNRNSIVDNTCINNRFNQIEIWQSDDNVVTGNKVQESTVGTGNLGAICLFDTTGTTCVENEVLSAQGNGIAAIAGTSNCAVSDNIITDTNRENNTSTPEKGNGILLDWNGVGDPQYITIKGNTIKSSDGTIAKSGVYSTSNTCHHNTIENNTITGYQYGVHPYAAATCGV